MGSIKPELLAKLKSALKEQSPISVSKQTTAKFNSTQTRIKSQSLASSLNLQALPKVKAPFLPPVSTEKVKQYTLVLDLDETLIHFVDLQAQG